MSEEGFNEGTLLVVYTECVVSDNKDYDECEKSIVVEIFIEKVETFVWHHPCEEQIVAKY